MRRCAARTRRAIGGAHRVCIDAGADAVAVAEQVGEGLRGAPQVHDREAAGLEAWQEFGPACDDGELLVRGEAHTPAEGAEGLAPEGVAELHFCQRWHEYEVFVDRWGDPSSAHGLATLGDHHDHQRPKTQRDADERRQIADEPQGKSPALYGREYTAPVHPADLAPLLPQNSGRSV